MQGPCCCQSGKDKPQSAPQGNAGPLRELTPLRPQPVDRLRYFGTGALVFAVWTGCYLAIEPLARLLTQAVPGLSERAAAALEFFLYDTAKILLLLLLMVYVIGWLRAGLHVERVRDFLAGRRRVLGYVLGAGFGAITPFCSCSSIPLFLGFTTSGIPVGITLAFLITSPLINEIAVVLLWGLLGWKLTLVYVLAGLGAGIIGGWFMDVLRAERWLQDYLKESIASGAAQQPIGTAQRKIGLRERHLFASGETRSIFRRVWRWVIIGVGLGALLHGYVPEAWFAEHLGAGQWWSVPAAVAVGIPLYTNVTGIVPIMESLLLKGLPVGTTLAFCMSAVAASLPEVLMLRQVMRGKLLALFLGTLLVLFSLLGWLLNAVQGWLL